VQEFFSLIPANSQPDYLAIHVYTTTFDSFREMIESYYRTFGLPIMVTEFAMQVRHLYLNTTAPVRSLSTELRPERPSSSITTAGA